MNERRPVADRIHMESGAWNLHRVSSDGAVWPADHELKADLHHMNAHAEGLDREPHGQHSNKKET